MKTIVTNISQKTLFTISTLLCFSLSAWGDGNGNTNRIVKFVNPTTGGNSQIYDNGFNVGIGTTSPQYLLHLFKEEPVRSTVGVLMGNSTTGSGQRGFLVDYHRTGGAELWNFENTPMWFGTNGQTRMTITNNGDLRVDGSTFFVDASSNRVGLGTMNPSDVLHLRRGTATSVGVLMGNSLVPNGRRGFLVDYHGSGGAELWNFENTPMWFGTNGQKRMEISSDGRVGIGGAPTTLSYTSDPLLDVQGKMRLQHVPVWDGPDRHDLTWSVGASDGVTFVPAHRLISREGSSRRYKTNIRKSGEDFSKILKVEPKEYQMREGFGPPDSTSYGYIAEDLEEAGLEKLVIHDEEGKPDGVAYKKVALYVNEVVKTQQKTIERLEEDVKELQKMVRKLSER